MRTIAELLNQHAGEEARLFGKGPSLASPHVWFMGVPVNSLLIPAADVARADGIPLEVADKTVPIWSPHDSFQGAATLLQVLDEDKVAS